MFRLIVEIYEKKPYPVVVHTFYGITEKEVRGYCRAHMRTDAFFRRCIREGRYGRLECRAEQQLDEIPDTFVMKREWRS